MLKKKTETTTEASAVMGHMFNTHVDQGRAYIQYVCKEHLKHPALRSDLVGGCLVSTNPYC